MYENIIKNYVDKLTKEDIINYTKKEDIFLNDNEINVIYDEIKNKWKQLYNGNTRVITDLENKINNKAYNKLIDLYNTYKKFLN
ncbi:unknown [Clostridium sp. CAG:1193]|nr:unknown [Clostridium sp. CAG:1193]